MVTIVKRWLNIWSEKSKEKTILFAGQVNFRTSSRRWKRNRNLSTVQIIILHNDLIFCLEHL